MASGTSNSPTLSSNKNTTKERNRRANKTGFAEQLMKAKRADSGAWDWAKKQLKKSEAYQNASPDERTAMEKARKEEVMENRKLEGKHASCLKESDEEELIWVEDVEPLNFPLPESTSADENMKSDSSDHDDDDDDDDEEEEEENENEQIVLDEGGLDEEIDNDAEEVDEDQFKDAKGDQVVNINADYLEAVAVVHWNATLKYWFNGSASLQEKMTGLSKIPEDGKAHYFEVLPNPQKSAIKDMVKGDPSLTHLVEWTPPIRFFTEVEVALLQNLNAWFEGFRLPGPSKWWDERGPELKAKILDSSEYTADRAREAWEMIQFGKWHEVPKNSSLLEETEMKLCMKEYEVDDTEE